MDNTIVLAFVNAVKQGKIKLEDLKEPMKTEVTKALESEQNG